MTVESLANLHKRPEALACYYVTWHHTGKQENSEMFSIFFLFNFNVLNTSAHVWSLSTDGWKCALVNPGLDLRYKNLRPISILQYVSKLVERAVFNKRMDARLRTTPNQVLNYHIVLVTVPKRLCWRLWVTSFFPWIHNVSRFLYY